MKIEFIQKDLPENELEVHIAAAEKNQQVEKVLAALATLETTSPTVLSLKTDTGIQIIKIDDIIYVDVQANDLLLYTTQETLRTKERLTNFLHRLKSPDFVQVSKHAAVNMKHLKLLENSFSGSMVAKLSQEQQTVVSRRYVKDLMNCLGL
ncbi:LytTR family DNA-binding domain-containing protein [Leuconostocaceae bacterium ESL0958]|nr:LytTR family DNA-binding domain-containing protein [Leuconostocaceae bacterium ESL0958]